MKTFNDLVFKQHPCWSWTHATLDFDNWYWVSVVSWSCFYTDDNYPYEVAIMLDGNLCYTTDIADDVIWYCTANKVSTIMRKVQKLK
jgi:tRNA splicing ligase